MKKKRLPIIATSLMSLLFLGSCAETLPPENEQNYAHYYLVSFYVDNDLYRTARVKEGETIGEIIEAPTKDDFNFVGWQTSDGVAFDLTTSAVNSSLNLYANFEPISKPSTGEDESTLNVIDTKDSTKDYYLVLGWYGKSKTSGIDKSTMQHFYANVRVFLRAKGASEEELANVSVREYGTDLKVAETGALVNADGDVDLFFGMSTNIVDSANIPCIEVSDTYTINSADKRVTGLLTDNAMAKQLFDFLATDLGKQMFDSNFYLDPAEIPENPVEEVSHVEDRKDPNKTYSFVLGWYGKTATSGLDVDLMEHFYSNLLIYLSAINVSEEDISNITVRRYGGSDTGVEVMGEFINNDGDVDMLVGVGKNITSSGHVEVIEKVGDIPMGTETRYIARVTENEIAKSLYTFIKDTDAGKNMFDKTFTLTPVDVTK